MNKKTIQAGTLVANQVTVVTIFQRFNNTTQEFLLVVFEAIATGNKALLETCRKCVNAADFDLIVAEFRRVAT